MTWQLPIKTASEANSSEHWTKKAKRHRLQKQWINAAYHHDRPQIALPATIVLTRISPRKLDVQDNLPMAFKGIVDSLSECIYPGKGAGRADDSKDLTWEYRQEKGKPKEYAVRIEILTNETLA